MNSGTQGPASLVGQIIGGYQLTKVLGKGATGVVFLGKRLDETPALIERTQAVPIELPVEAAIKVLILPWQLEDHERAEFRERFLREAKTLRGLSHPHILRLLNYGEDEATGSPYMILPHLSGGTLQARLEDREQPMPLSEIKRLLAQIADAVDYAHRQGIVHRDIKPANILLDDRDQVYLSDFSIARLIIEATSRLTRTGLALGTPHYMAPETLAGQAATPAADIYSLGMVAYEMAAAPHGNNPGPQPPLSALRPDLPRPAEVTIMKAMAQEPAQRFATATEFAEAFSLGLDGVWPGGLTGYVAPNQPTTHEATAPTQPNAFIAATAPPAGSAHPTGGGSQRNRLLAILGVVLLLLLIMGGAAGAVLAMRGQSPGTSSIAQIGSPSASDSGSFATATTVQATATATTAPKSRPTHPPIPGATSNTITTVPNEPSNLTVTALDASSIRIQWSDNSDNEAGFAITDDGGGTWNYVGANTTSYTWGGYSAGSYECFYIVAYNGAGDSAATPFACTTTLTVPNAPSNLTVTALDSTSIRIQWSDNSDNEAGFKITNDGGGTWKYVGANTTSYTWGGFSAGSYECFYIVAYNGAGDSAATPFACTTTQP